MTTSNPDCGCCKARFIKFRLCDDLRTSDRRQRAEVLAYWDGENPAPDVSCSSVEELFVYNLARDVDTYYFSAPADSVGYAVLDDQTEIDGDLCVYRILVLADSDALIRFCLAQDHPGRGKVFDVTIGTWDSSLHDWVFDGPTVKCIDWHHDGPYPEAGARGYAIRKPSDEYGLILVPVSMDCVSPGSCEMGYY